MAISFNEVPSTLRVPSFFVEFDNSQAVQGPTLMQYKALMLGQKLSSGSATVNVPVTVTSAEQAKTLFGAGSMLVHMCERWFNNNTITSLTVIPLSDNSSSVAANATLTFSGTASAAGAVNLYVNGRKISVPVSASDAAADVAEAVAAAIEAESDYPVSAEQGTDANTHIVTLTHKHKGAIGNECDLRINYYEGEALPAGISCTVGTFSSGTLAPSLTSAISAMGEEQYNVIAFPYTDADSLSAIESELSDRWGPIRQNDGMAFTAKAATHGSLLTFGDGRNSPFVSCQGIYKHPVSAYEFAAAYAAVIAMYGNIDPARPFQTLEVKGVLPPALGDRLTMQERNLLLFDGISTNYVDAGGVVRLERAITMYQENALGATDPSYLDVNTVLTLSYLRFDFRAYFLRKYPRHKLADDGYRVPPGQAVITPKLAKAECVAIYENWLDLGLVENVDGFKESLIVERNALDRNRLDFFLSPDLMNQLIVGAGKFAFIL